MNNPYNDVQKTDFFLREFDNNINQNELIWHRDKKNREVTVLNGMNWKFQYDNSLPFILRIGDTFRVPAETYHRLIKGTTALLLKIKELEE